MPTFDRRVGIGLCVRQHNIQRYGVSASGQMGERRMREKLYITFHSEDDIRHFVDTCNEFDDAIDIRIQKTAMDAKSLLGMLLMKTEEPLEIEYACYDDEDNYEEFKQAILEKYDIKVVPAAEKPAENKIV